MNKSMTMLMAAAMLCLASIALAVPPVPASPCLSDDDCADGEICEMSDCPNVDCDPDDPDCKPVDCDEEGWCSPEGGGLKTPASECDTDADCPNGFACDVVGSMGTTCVCAEGEDDCDCGEESTTTEEWKACRPMACEADADCGEGLACHLYEMDCPPTLSIPVPDCPPDNPDCNKDKPTEPPKGDDCEPITKGICGPVWIGACETAADCGPGFDCAAVEICECSGSSGSAPTPVPGPTPDPDDGDSDGGSSDDPSPTPTPGSGGSGKADESKSDDDGDDDDEDCDCKPSDESYCKLIETACETDADCTIDGWTCFQFNDDDATCTFDIETGKEDCEEEESESVCVPFWQAR